MRLNEKIIASLLLLCSVRIEETTRRWPWIYRRASSFQCGRSSTWIDQENVPDTRRMVDIVIELGHHRKNRCNRTVRGDHPWIRQCFGFEQIDGSHLHKWWENVPNETSSSQSSGSVHSVFDLRDAVGVSIESCDVENDRVERESPQDNLQWIDRCQARLRPLEMLRSAVDASIWSWNENYSGTVD